jgi:hypothetical protein
MLLLAAGYASAALTIGGLSVGAEDAETVEVTYIGGGDSSYASGSLTWTNADGLIYIFTTEGSIFLFEEATLNFEYSLANDMSAGGVASAAFDLVGDWTISLKNTYGSSLEVAVEIAGSMYDGGPFGGQYIESAISPSGPLDGSAWLQVDSTVLTVSADWLSSGGVDLEWSDSVIGMDVDVSLDAEESIADYTNGSYDSNGGLTVILYNDESLVVPEPATMILLGLGSLLTLRKRRA